MDVCAVLTERFPKLETERDFSFAAHTTIGSGGIASLAVSPQSAEELADVLAFLESQNIPYCFLGAGANVLPPDGVYGGIVVRFHRLKTLYEHGGVIYAGAGVTGGELLRFAKSRSLGSFEPFTGIPMTVGGGVAMNAGIRDKHFSDLVSRVVGIEHGKIRTFSLEECAYSEKNSIFLRGIAVAGALLKAEHSTPEQIEQETARYLLRRKHLPKGRSMGCTFVNPAGKSAGQIIQQCGLKGRSIGKAHVSNEHANFIINEGESSADIACLIDIVKEEVLRQTGIELREEIRRLPHT